MSNDAIEIAFDVIVRHKYFPFSRCEVDESNDHFSKGKSYCTIYLLSLLISKTFCIMFGTKMIKSKNGLEDR